MTLEMKYVATGIVAAASMVLALTACSPSASTPDESAEPDPRPQPVLDGDFPDPDVLRVGDTYYAYATNDEASNVQVATSTDLQTWERQDDAMPQLPSWIVPGNTWAPEVAEVTPGSFVLYFTAANDFPARQCIGIATSADPAGPFAVQGDGMLLCPADEGGAIDAGTFVDDDGSLHLVWKNDGNCCGLDTWIQTAPLSADGLTIAGPIRKLIMQTLDWEGELVEAPTLVKRDSTYVLLYSSNAYYNDLYSIGYATAPSLDGPWTKNPEPFLSSAGTDLNYLGPGGQDVVEGDDGTDFLVFHGWDTAFSTRSMYVLPLEWDGAVPRLVLGD